MKESQFAFSDAMKIPERHAAENPRAHALRPSAAASGKAGKPRAPELVCCGRREQLRRRFSSGDDEPLPDADLLELLLFSSLPRANVRPLVEALLARFGNLDGVIAAARHKEVIQVPGVTEEACLQLRLVEAAARRVAKV